MKTTTARFRPQALLNPPEAPASQSTPLIPATDLKSALEFEIAHCCRGEVTKRLALKLALAVISEAKGGMFYAEKLAARLEARLKYESALREVYLERRSK